MDEQVGSSEQWVLAGVFVGVALLAAVALDRVLARRARALATAVVRGEISPATDTRLRFLRRLASAAIVLLGVALALSQFTEVKSLAASVLASGAIAAAVLGFAARQTLANLVAGIMIAVTQPVRVGDWVLVGEHYGVVEDVRLNYTFLRTLGEQRIVIPNEKLASEILRNDTLASGEVALDVSIWLPPGADVRRAVAALEDETGQPVSVVELTVDGVRLAIGAERCPPPERGAREAALRLACLARLRADGLVPVQDPVH